MITTLSKQGRRRYPQFGNVSNIVFLAPRSGGIEVVPSTTALVLTTFAPTVVTPVLCTPSVVALTITTFEPTVNVSSGLTLVPSTVALVLATFAPIVTVVELSPTVTPSTLALVITAYLPTVTATVTPPSDPVLVSNQAYWGRFQRGGYLNISFNSQALPDDVPVVTYWREGTTSIGTESLHFVKSPNRTFLIRKLLDESFTDGNYIAVMEYDVSSVEYTAIGYFQVQGGTGEAPIIALTEIDRPLGRAVVTQDELGNALIGYKPKRLLP